MASIVSITCDLPRKTRENSDPIFHVVRNCPHARFWGFRQRRVLTPGEDILDHLHRAATNALAKANIGARDIDYLLGGVSLEESTPNALCRLHDMLKLPAKTPAVSLNSDFSLFNHGLVVADSLIESGQAANVMVAVGGDWSRRVDYSSCSSKGAELGAADGAAAAVVSKNLGLWEIVGSENLTRSEHHRHMGIERDRVTVWPPVRGFPHLRSEPYFKIEGFDGFQQVRDTLANQCLHELLKKQAVRRSQVTVYPHQATRDLLDAWQSDFGDAKIFDTLEQFGNMTVANVPVNLAHGMNAAPKRDYAVLLSLGPEVHVHTILLRRVAAAGAPKARAADGRKAGRKTRAGKKRKRGDRG